MKLLSHAVIIGGLTLVALVGVIVCAVLKVPVPDVLPAIGLSGLAALAGLSIPTTAAAPLSSTTPDIVPVVPYRPAP